MYGLGYEEGEVPHVKHIILYRIVRILFRIFYYIRRRRPGPHGPYPLHLRIS